MQKKTVQSLASSNDVDSGRVWYEKDFRTFGLPSIRRIDAVCSVARHECRVPSTEELGPE